MRHSNNLFRLILTGLCALSLIALFFTFATSTVTASVGEAESSAYESVSGWEAAFLSLIGWIIVAAPVAMLAVQYIDALAPYRKLSFVLPIATILELFLLRFATDLFASAGDVSGSFSIETTTSAGTGFYLMLFAQLGVLACWFMMQKKPANEAE